MVRSALARDCVVRPADDLFLLYHRPSGETHVVAAEMMAILAALDDAPGEAEAVVERLARDYDLETEGGDSALEIVTARIAELSALGLIDRVR